MNPKHPNHLFSDNEGNEDYKTKHKKLLGYDIPDNYFETSKSDIINAIEELDNNAAKPSMNLFRKSYATYAIAASILLLIALGVFKGFEKNTDSNSPLIVLEEIYPQDEHLMIGSL